MRPLEASGFAIHSTALLVFPDLVQLNKLALITAGNFCSNCSGVVYGQLQLQCVQFPVMPRVRGRTCALATVGTILSTKHLESSQN